MTGLPPMILLACALLSCGAVSRPLPDDAKPDVSSAAMAPVDDTSIERRIRSAFALAADVPIRHDDREMAQIREIVRRRVSARLLPASKDMSSRDYLFTPADGIQRHLGMFRIGYADPGIARARRAGIAKQRFFDESKILTPMTSAARGTELFVFYTETGVDPKMQTLLNDIARATAADGDRTAAGS